MSFSTAFRKRSKLHPPNFGKGCHGFYFQSWLRHAHAEELGFRDFSSFFLVKENRRQLGNSACCISCVKVSLTSRVFAMDGRSESRVQCEILNLAIELNCSTKIPRKRQIRATVNRLTKSDLTVIAAHQRKDRSDA